MRTWPRAVNGMGDRLVSLVVAIGLAVLVWLYARSREQEVLDNVPIPVAVTLPPSLVDRYDLDVDGPAQIPVSFRGPPSLVRELRGVLQRGELRVAVTLGVPDERLKESRYLDTVRIDAEDVHAPPGITPLVLEGRNRIPVTLRRLVERQLPVRLDPPPDERVGPVRIEPVRVRVRGPQDILDRLRAIPTEPVALPSSGDVDPGQEVVFNGPVALVRQMDGRPVHCSPDTVTVHLAVRPRQKLYELAEVPVQFLCPADFRLRPRFVEPGTGKVALRIWGPMAAEPPAVVAYVDLACRKFESGFYADEPLRVQLPNECQLAQPPPKAAPFRLVPIADSMAPPRQPASE